MDEKHTTIISSDEPVTVSVDGSGGRWFRMFCHLVETGAWARMSDSACRVYVVLAKHASRDWIAWPSLATLADVAGCSTASVKRATNELQHEGLLQRFRGGGRRSTCYRLLDLPATPSLPFPVAVQENVRYSSAGSPVSQQQAHQRASRRLTREPLTRPLNQTQTTSSDAAVGKAIEAMKKIGVSELVARTAVADYGADQVTAATKTAAGKKGVRNPAGLALSMLQRGEVPKAPRSAEDEIVALKASLETQRRASEAALAAYRASRDAGRPGGPLGA